MSTTTRRGLLTAAVFVLAAIGGAIGNQLSQRLDAAAVSFAVVLVLGAAAAIGLDRVSQRSAVSIAGQPDASASSNEQSVPRSSDEPSAATMTNFDVRIRRGKNIQIGNNNEMRDS
jgi:RIP homotypic interaction motif